MEESSERRVRINLKQVSSGAVTFDITSESPSVAGSGKNLAEAIDETRKVCVEKNLKLAGEAA